MQRIRTRRNRNQPPITAATLDPDTVEVVIRAISDLESAELAIRRNPRLAAQEPVTRLLQATQALTQYLQAPLEAAKDELTELNAPAGAAREAARRLRRAVNGHDRRADRTAASRPEPLTR